MGAPDEDMAKDGEDSDEGGQVNTNAYPEQFSDSEEEKEDFTIRKSDSLIVAATAENDHSNLEVYIYEHAKGNLYVHHEVILGAYPLCLEWIHHWNQKKANLIAVGTFLPEIEIWNLDSDSVDPVAVLGHVKPTDEQLSAMGGAKVTADAFDAEQSHSDAVMSISVNPF